MGWIETVVVVALLALVLVLARPSAAVVARDGHRFAETYELWIAPASVAAIDRAHRRERRAHAVAGGIGLAIYAVLRVTLDVPPLVLLWPVVCVCAAGASLVALRAAGTEFPVPPGAPSFARVRAVRLRDYLPTQALVALGVWPVLAFGGAILAGAALRRGVANEDAAWTALASGIALGLLGLLLPVLAVTLCRRPEPAGDASHLYLQDAWRVANLRWMLSVEGIGVALLVARVLDLMSAAAASAWVLPVVFAGWIWHLLGQSGRLHFRRRLWPDLVPGERVAMQAGVSA